MQEQQIKSLQEAKDLAEWWDDQMANDPGDSVEQLFDEMSRKVRGFLSRVPDSISTPSTIGPITLANDGENPHGFTAEASYTGDPGIYDELRISVFDTARECVADVLVGLDSHGQPRVLVTDCGLGDTDHRISICPMKRYDEAVELHSDGI